MFINCTSKGQDELLTRVEEMTARRVGLKAELYYHNLSEEEDLSKLVTIVRNATKILNFHYTRNINFTPEKKKIPTLTSTLLVMYLVKC